MKSFKQHINETLSPVSIDTTGRWSIDIRWNSTPSKEELKRIWALAKNLTTKYSLPEMNVQSSGRDTSIVLPDKENMNDKWKKLFNEFGDEFVKMYNFHESVNESINKYALEKPDIFTHTIYRMPTDKELDEFSNFPNMSPKEIYNGFGYTMIGKGILDKRIKKMMIDSIQLLINKFPNDNRYKEALKMAENNSIKESVNEAVSDADIKKAFDLGVKAFHDGKKSVPIHDPELMKLLKSQPDLTMGSGTSQKIFDAWAKGWHQEYKKANNLR